MFGKRAGEFSPPIPLFHDHTINLAAKILQNKRFAAKVKLITFQARFPCAERPYLLRSAGFAVSRKREPLCKAALRSRTGGELPRSYNRGHIIIAARGTWFLKLTKNAEHGLLGIFVNFIS